MVWDGWAGGFSVHPLSFFHFLGPFSALAKIESSVPLNVCLRSLAITHSLTHSTARNFSSVSPLFPMLPGEFRSLPFPSFCFRCWSHFREGTESAASLPAPSHTPQTPICTNALIILTHFAFTCSIAYVRFFACTFFCTGFARLPQHSCFCFLTLFFTLGTNMVIGKSTSTSKLSLLGRPLLGCSQSFV